MLKHVLVAALRNMAANRLQTAIAIFGLSIGITAALLMALVIRNQLMGQTWLVARQKPVLALRYE